MCDDHKMEYKQGGGWKPVKTCKHEGCDTVLTDNDMEDQCYDCWRVKCQCGSGEYWEEVYDASGIYVGRMCKECCKDKLSGYRPEIFTDTGYETDEPKEEEL